MQININIQVKTVRSFLFINTESRLSAASRLIRRIVYDKQQGFNLRNLHKNYNPYKLMFKNQSLHCRLKIKGCIKAAFDLFIYLE